MCMNTRFYPKTNLYPTFEERVELVKSIARLNDWIFDEIAYFQEDPILSRKIIRKRNCLPLNG